MNNIGERIKQKRIEINQSQQDFASNIGITQSKISAIEKGKNNPSFETLLALKDYLKVSYDWLIEGKENDTFKLSEEEKEVLELFNKLSDKEKWKLIGQLEYITKSNEEQTATIEGKSSALRNTV